MRERRPMGIGRLGTRAVSDRRARRDHRRVRPDLRRARPADHRRAGRRRRATACAPVDERRAALAARLIGDARRGPAAGQAACRRSTSATPHDAVVMLDGDTVHAAARRRASSWRGCRTTSTSRRRCASGWRRSTTSTCGSTSGCTCDRPATTRGRRRSGSEPGRGREDSRGTTANGTWSGSTSARRRCAPSSAKLLDDGGLDIIGIGVAESKGLKRGVVVNLEAAVESIKKAIEEAELMAGVEIDSVHLGAQRPAHQGLQQPRRGRGGRQEPRDHARRRAARDRRGEGGVAAGRPRDPARAAAGLRRRRAGRHRRAGRA